MTRGRPPIPADQRQAIVATLEHTHSASEAARFHGVNVSTAWRIAKAAGVELTGLFPMSAEQRQAIVATLEDTHNARQAARQNGVGRYAARRIAREEGIELAQKHPTKRKRSTKRRPIAALKL